MSIFSYRVNMTEKNTPSSDKTTQIGLSLGTIPVLLLTIGTEAASKSLIEIGKAAEEVFRGDLLPILHVPEQKKEAKTD